MNMARTLRNGSLRHSSHDGNWLQSLALPTDLVTSSATNVKMSATGNHAATKSTRGQTLVYLGTQTGEELRCERGVELGMGREEDDEDVETALALRLFALAVCGGGRCCVECCRASFNSCRPNESFADAGGDDDSPIVRGQDICPLLGLSQVELCRLVEGVSGAGLISGVQVAAGEEFMAADVVAAAAEGGVVEWAGRWACGAGGGGVASRDPIQTSNKTTNVNILPRKQLTRRPITNIYKRNRYA